MGSDSDSSEASVASSSSSSASSSSSSGGGSSSSSSSNSNSSNSSGSKRSNDGSIGVPGLNDDGDNNGSENSDSSSSHHTENDEADSDHDDISGILNSVSKQDSTISASLNTSNVSNDDDGDDGDDDDVDSSHSNSTSDSETVQTSETIPIQPPSAPVPTIVPAPSAPNNTLYGNIGKDEDEDDDEESEENEDEESEGNENDESEENDDAASNDSTSDSDTIETSESIPIQPSPMKPTASNNNNSTASMESAISDGPSLASASSASIDSGEASQASDEVDDDDENDNEEEANDEEESESSDSNSDDKDESTTSVSETVLTELPAMKEVASSPAQADELSAPSPTEADISKDGTSDSETVLTEPELKVDMISQNLEASNPSLEQPSTSSSNATSISDTVLTEPNLKGAAEAPVAKPDTFINDLSLSSISVRAHDNKPENVAIHVKGDNETKTKKGKEKVALLSPPKSSKMDGSLSGLLDFQDKYILSQSTDNRSVEDMSVLTEDTTIKKLGDVHVDENPKVTPLESIDESVFSVILEENEDASRDDSSMAASPQPKRGIPSMFDSRKSIHSEESTLQTESEMLNLQFNGNTADVFPISTTSPNVLDGVPGYDTNRNTQDELTNEAQPYEHDMTNISQDEDTNHDNRRDVSIGKKKGFFGLFKRGLGMPPRRSKRENDTEQSSNIPITSNHALPSPSQTTKDSNDRNMAKDPTGIIDRQEAITGASGNPAIQPSKVEALIGHTTTDHQSFVVTTKNEENPMEADYFSKPPPATKSRKMKNMLRTKSFESSDGESSKASKNLFGFLRRHPTKKPHNSSQDDVPLFAYMDSADFSEAGNSAPTLPQATDLHTDTLPFTITNDDDSVNTHTPHPYNDEPPNLAANKQQIDSPPDPMGRDIEKSPLFLDNHPDPKQEAKDRTTTIPANDSETSYIEKLRMESMESGSVSEYDSDDDQMSHDMENGYDSSVVPSLGEGDDKQSNDLRYVDTFDDDKEVDDESADDEEESEEEEACNDESSPLQDRNLDDNSNSGEETDDDENEEEDDDEEEEEDDDENDENGDDDEDEAEADSVNSVDLSQNGAESDEESDEDLDAKDESDASDDQASCVSNDDSEDNGSASSGVAAESLENADDESNSQSEVSNSENSNETDESDGESEDGEENSNAEDCDNEGSSKGSEHSDIEDDKVVEFVDLSDMISVSSAMSNRVYGARKETETFDIAGGDAMFEPFQTDEDPVEDMTNMEIFTGFNFYATKDDANEDDECDNDESEAGNNSASSLEDEDSEELESEDEENSQKSAETEPSHSQEEEDSEQLESIGEDSDRDGEDEAKAGNATPTIAPNTHTKVLENHDHDDVVKDAVASTSPTREVSQSPQNVNTSDSRPRPEQRRKSFLAAFGFGSRVDTEAVETKLIDSSHLPVSQIQPPTVPCEADEASTAYDVEEVLASNAIVQDEKTATDTHSNANDGTVSIEFGTDTLKHNMHNDWDVTTSVAKPPSSHEEITQESHDNLYIDDDVDIMPADDDETVKNDDTTDKPHKRGSNIFRFPFFSKKANHSKLDDERGELPQTSPYDVEKGDVDQYESYKVDTGSNHSDLVILNASKNGAQRPQESAGHPIDKASLGSFFNGPNWQNASNNSSKLPPHEQNYTGRTVINNVDFENDASIVMEQSKSVLSHKFDQRSDDIESGYALNNTNGSTPNKSSREPKRKKSKDQKSSNIWCIIAIIALAILGLIIGASIGSLVGRKKGGDFAPASISTVLVPTSSPSMLRPTKAPTVHQTTYNVLCEVLLDCNPLLDETSPQGLAFQWINDPSKNNFDLNQQPNKAITRFALATIYYSTNGASWVDATDWLSSSDECKWFSTSTNVPICDDAGNFVTLALDNNNLNGKLPAEVALLNNLTSISINNPADSMKSLNGRLDSIFQGASGQALTKLTSLSIIGNIFTGGIPSELNELKLLRSLDLSYNDLRGYIPYSLNSMPGLEYVNLQSNRLTGGIPSEFCLGATNLIDLNLSDNIFTSVPESIDALTSLSRLNMAKNQFVTFPTPITRMLNLQSLDISDNKFGGAVPSSIGNMKSLQELYLRSNDLTGSIPESIGNLVQLSKVLDLSQNRFTGSIPTSLSQLVQLQQVFLNSNQLSGALPEELIRWNALDLVRLDENAFIGTIPILLCQEWSGIQSYADCSGFNISSTGSTVPSSCFTFCCQAEECVCNYEVSDPLRCLG